MKFLSLASALALASTVYAGLFDGEGIVKLTSDTWADKVENDAENAWVVTFYADWCPYCGPFSDEYAKAAKDPLLEGKKVLFGAVDVMANRDLTTRYAIKRSPTVKIFGRDRAAPEDYLGHRKQVDLVAHCDTFCTTHDYLVPPPAPKVATFDYNIDAIVASVAAQHDARIGQAQTVHQQALQTLNTSWTTSLAELTATYNTRYENLVKERTEAMQAAYDAHQETVAGAKSEHAANIAALDGETVSLIEGII